MGAILATPWLFHPFEVFGLGVSINSRLVKGFLECLKLSPVGIAVGGGTPEAGPLPRGLRLQHDDVFGFRGDVNISVASFECWSKESSLTYRGAALSDSADVIGPLGSFTPTEIERDVINRKTFCNTA